MTATEKPCQPIQILRENQIQEVLDFAEFIQKKILLYSAYFLFHSDWNPRHR
ncbi:DUF2281 domain-containing protein [Sodalinema gerasimenkoae]|uniref:DUF2281 domain-containing protein n=1 Tax=Sodalinema gerasimenkoae TaxID=2862348 RepID=UPI001FEAA4A1|nr:DUF2281 domain-containing protein [Sodalinema gerasimenkoae]